MEWWSVCPDQSRKSFLRVVIIFDVPGMGALPVDTLSPA